MDLEHLDYDLPEHLIAQEPVEPRDSSRLLVVDRATGQIEHRVFRDLPDLLRAPDCLVLNNTRVLPARLLGERTKTGGRWEGLFLHVTPDDLWELICQTRGKMAPGESVHVGDDCQLILRERLPNGHWLMEPDPAIEPEELLSRIGRVPLPPYIRSGQEGEGDRGRYQTVYASQAGAAAAPTAGLHFTPDLLESLRGHGVELIELTLHVGSGTFQPIRGTLDEHNMHREWGELRSDAAHKIQQSRQSGGRTVAVGTTSVRVLESASQGEELGSWKGETALFIRPPYRFSLCGCSNHELPPAPHDTHGASRCLCWPRDDSSCL